MKRGILLLGALLMISTVNANNSVTPTINNEIYNRYDEAISFVEKGILFRVYLDGDFDFDRRRFRNRRGINRIRIERDFRGRIRRVGNVFINYNIRGDVRRVGNIFMRYNRRGFLTRVGNLKIYYNRWGDPSFFGRVRYNDSFNNFYDGYYSGGIYGYSDPFFYRRDFRNNYRQFREDNNFYYYRARTNNGKIKKGDVIKRRKPKTVQKKRTTKKRVEERKRTEVRKRRSS